LEPLNPVNKGFLLHIHQVKRKLFIAVFMYPFQATFIFYLLPSISPAYAVYLWQPRVSPCPIKRITKKMKKE